MEKRALLALGLSFIVFIAFIYLGQKMAPPPPPESPAAQTAQAPPPAPAAPRPEAASPPPAAAQPTPPPVQPKRPAREVTVDTPLYQAVFSEMGGGLKSFKLKKYRENMPFSSIFNFKLGPVDFEVQRYLSPEKMQPHPKELVRLAAGQELPLSLGFDSKAFKVPTQLLYEASQPGVTLKPGENATLTFTGVSPEGLVLTKTLSFRSDSYLFDVGVKVENRSSSQVDGMLDLDLTTDYSGDHPGKAGYLGFYASVNQHLESLKTGSLKEIKTFTGKIDWTALDETYFLMALAPKNSPQSLVTVKEKPTGPMDISVRTPEALAPGQSAQVSFAAYFGPKDLSDLKALNLGLERTVDFGWFQFLAVPLFQVLKFFDNYTHNWGWAIIILTILIRIVFFYPSHKSYKSMKEMQKLQPKVAKLREKYKDDKEAMNKELMALYRTFKVNPLSGCLPMVMQLPVFIALYNVLGYAIELRHTPFIATLPFTDIVWLADLSSKDPLLITPLVMGATMFIQQKMTPSPGDPAQAKMMMFLPVVFTFLFLNFASGLVVYWLVNNVLSIIQQYYTNKYLT